ncbi:hypothetical protein THIOM_002035 [Candidatus Thiomargarita nelsonii]|uniref:Uncharacterized protein n=1 Tax=Candidatus Thiomargarita nelsonii TaxID=1003181 RepID=A0A176S297_9GAMM|nr:hypothetical protein THIOM_002035 [Candidatus Thiomargarita nelsonii]
MKFGYPIFSFAATILDPDKALHRAKPNPLDCLHDEWLKYVAQLQAFFHLPQYPL